MGTSDVAQAASETIPSSCSFKVHGLMCTEVMKSVDQIMKILPTIEEARPRGQGMEALCSLSRTIDKTKLLLRDCRESSTLYMAVTGDKTIQRFQRETKHMEKSLRLIQNTVSTMLAVKISQIVDDLKGIKFMLGSSEEEARKALREWVKQNDTIPKAREDSEIRTLKIVGPMLHITSQEAISAEKLSLTKMREKVGDSDQTKMRLLNKLYELLSKHEHLIISSEEFSDNNAQSRPQAEFLTTPLAPEEFKCPLSSKLMFDPVLISSGETYERGWIKKWLDEGNNTCPKTQTRLTDLSMTPHIALKSSISKWCTENGVSIPDPNVQLDNSWEISSNSISSLGSSMNDISLHIGLGNIPLGYLNSGYNLDSVRTRTRNDPQNILYEELEFSSGFNELAQENQCKVIEDMTNRLKENGGVAHVLSENFMERLERFLRDALNLHNSRALRDGLELLRTLVSSTRNGTPTNGIGDMLGLLDTLLQSEPTSEVFTVLEALSTHPNYKLKLLRSDILPTVLKILDSQAKGSQESALKILCNLSSNNDSNNNEICSKMISLNCIPKLVPLFQDESLSGKCILILENLCNAEEGRVSITETEGCLESIARVVDSNCEEEQEHAVQVLLSLCSQRVEYCKLVMSEDVFSSIFIISRNGSEEGKAKALELVRLLKDVDCSCSHKEVHEKEELDSLRDCGSNEVVEEKRGSTKTTRLFGRISKPSFLTRKMR